MALFRFSTEPPTRPLIRTENLILRAPQASDYAAWSLLRIESRAFLTPWEPVWNEDDLTRNSFRLRVKRAAREIAADEAYSLFVLDARSEMLLGGLTLGLVRRGAYRPAPGWARFSMQVLAASALLAVFLMWSAGSVNWVAFEGGALLRVGLMAAIVVGAALLYFVALVLSGLKLRQFVRK